MNVVTVEQVVAKVESFIDTPFHHQGRVPGVGMDCPATLICMAWDLGLKPRTWNVNGYGRVPDGRVLQRLCDENMIRTDVIEVACAALVRFREGHPQHLGVVVDVKPDGRVYWVEAESRKHRRVIKTRLVWTERHTQLVAAYRIPGVAYP